MKKANIIKLIVAISLPLAVGAIAGMFTASSVQEWYSSLKRPTFNPPNWVFGPVWTTLYYINGHFFLPGLDTTSKQQA